MGIVIEFLKQVNNPEDILGSILMGFATIGGAVGLLWGIVKAIIKWIKSEKEKKDRITRFRYVSRLKLKPKDIMHDRGEIVNGFDANTYLSRKEVDGEIEAFLRTSNKTSNLLVVTGLLSSGKSRAVYETIRKSDIKTVALCYSPEGDKNYEWSLTEWKTALEELEKKRNCVLCIDSLSDVEFDDSADEDTLLERWKKILKLIHSLKIRCIVTLAKPSIENEESFAKRFMDICYNSPDEITGEGNASASITIVQIPEISRTDEFYDNCKRLLSVDYYSPVVGDFVLDRYNKDIWKRINKLSDIEQTQVIRMVVAIILSLKYNQSSHNVIPCSFLEKVYFHLAQEANVTEDKLNEDYTSACNLLESFKLIRMSVSRAVCVIKGENGFEYIKDRLFNLLDDYHEAVLKDLTKKAEGVVAMVAPYIRKNDNLYIEKKQAELIISLDPETPEFYKDTIVHCCNKNRLIVAERVHKLFKEQFFELDENKKLNLKSVYKNETKKLEAICDTIGVVISRTCRTYDGVKKLLDDYLNAGVKISEDIICELLRISTEEDVTGEDKQNIVDYALSLADRQFSDKGMRGVNRLLAESARFNTAYESISKDYNAERIEQGLELHAKNLRDTFNAVKDAFISHQENQLDRNSNKTYQKEWDRAKNSLFDYCRKLTGRIRSTTDLRALLDILSTEKAQSLGKEINKELNFIDKHNTNGSFYFVNASYTFDIAQSVLKYNPMGYIGECEEMTILLFKNVSDPKFRYVFNAQSIVYLVGTKGGGRYGYYSGL